jgi:hypothetical protein
MSNDTHPTTLDSILSSLSPPEKRRFATQREPAASSRPGSLSGACPSRSTFRSPWLAVGMLLAINATAAAGDRKAWFVDLAGLEGPMPTKTVTHAAIWLAVPGFSRIKWQLDLPIDQEQLDEAALLIIPRGNEMSVMFGTELDRSDRHFRARVVDWLDARSHSAGLMSDFLIHGSDSGVHLDMQSVHSLMLRWDSRF